MTDTAKPTAGPWEIHGTSIMPCPDSDDPDTMLGIAEVIEWDDGDRDESVTMANARLIAEAGTVYHETGLTPRQLVEQRDGLLRALQEIVLNDPYKQSSAGKVAEHAIAKVEAKP